jgi:DNA mismatch repair protein MutS
VRNFAVAVKKRGDDVTFLRRIVRGAADGSFGIEVAKLAGVPEPVLQRAKIILKELEAQEQAKLSPHKPGAAPDPQAAGETLVHTQALALVQLLRQLDPDTLTPIEALTQLYELVRQARGAAL